MATCCGCALNALDVRSRCANETITNRNMCEKDPPYKLRYQYCLLQTYLESTSSVRRGTSFGFSVPVSHTKSALYAGLSGELS